MAIMAILSVAHASSPGSSLSESFTPHNYLLPNPANRKEIAKDVEELLRLLDLARKLTAVSDPVQAHMVSPYGKFIGFGEDHHIYVTPSLLQHASSVISQAGCEYTGCTSAPWLIGKPYNGLAEVNWKTPQGKKVHMYMHCVNYAPSDKDRARTTVQVNPINYKRRFSAPTPLMSLDVKKPGEI